MLLLQFKKDFVEAVTKSRPKQLSHLKSAAFDVENSNNIIQIMFHDDF